MLYKYSVHCIVSSVELFSSSLLPSSPPTPLPSFFPFLSLLFHPSYTQYYTFTPTISPIVSPSYFLTLPPSLPPSLSPFLPSSLPLSLPPSLSPFCFPLCLLCTLPYSLHVYLQNGSTALIIASECGHVEVVQLLIGRGANINISNNVRYIIVGLCLYLCECINTCMHVYVCVVVWPSG